MLEKKFGYEFDATNRFRYYLLYDENSPVRIFQSSTKSTTWFKCMVPIKWINSLNLFEFISGIIFIVSFLTWYSQNIENIWIMILLSLEESRVKLNYSLLVLLSQLRFVIQPINEAAIVGFNYLNCYSIFCSQTRDLEFKSYHRKQISVLT